MLLGIRTTESVVEVNAIPEEEWLLENSLLRATVELIGTIMDDGLCVRSREDAEAVLVGRGVVDVEVDVDVLDKSDTSSASR